MKVSTVEREAGTQVSPLEEVNCMKDFHLLLYRRKVGGFLVWSRTTRNCGLSSMPSDEETGHRDGEESHRAVRVS